MYRKSNNMEYLGINEFELNASGGVYTAKEISNQPFVWKSTFQKLSSESSKVKGFWEKALSRSKKIILTGGRYKCIYWKFTGRILSETYGYNNCFNSNDSPGDASSKLSCG